MRVLVSDPAEIRSAQYQRFVQRAQLEALMADHLVDGEPYLAPNAVVLSAGEHTQLRRLTDVFARALHRAGTIVMSDSAQMVEWGFPWVAAELLAAEEPRIPLIGRLDFVCDVSGHWWLLEFNADTPSGIREAIVVDHIAHASIPAARRLQRPNVGLGRALIRAFEASVRDVSKPRRLGLLTSANELEDLAQMAFTEDLLREPLGGLGLEVVLGDADNLRATASGLSLCGRPIGALYRYVPYEAIFGTPIFAAIAEATASGRVGLLNGLFGLLLQHKGLLAWVWDHRDDPRFAEEERDAIEQHLPPTWMINDRPDDVPAEHLVAKQVFGREGAEVLFGEDITPDIWDELHRRRTYVAQQRIDVVEQEGVVWTSLGPKLQPGRATVGAYAADGEWAGYYTRFGGKIITSRAKWLATFAEKEGA